MGVVALAEIGDKTQLLALLLAARFKKPFPIIMAILAATLVNHGLAGALGSWMTDNVDPEILRWLLGGSFIAMAVWTLIPDEIEEDETIIAKHLGLFGATAVTFFLAEMGDKNANCDSSNGRALSRADNGCRRNNAWNVDLRCSGCICRRQIRE
jgi:putative Ca2+/H+ antiporter (TMEM165/GDT1 family)